MAQTSPLPDPVRRALASVEAVTGCRIDPRADWPVTALIALGCGSELATEIAALLDGADAHTVELGTTAIEGLSPIGDEAPAETDPLAPRGWPRRARAARG